MILGLSRCHAGRQPCLYTTGMDREGLIAAGERAQWAMDTAWDNYQQACRDRAAAFRAIRDAKAGVTEFAARLGLSPSAFHKATSKD